MKAAIEQFRTNLGYVRQLGALYTAIHAPTTQALDLSDILRAQIVMVVSALDQYIHEVVRLGMLETQSGTRLATPAFMQFPITLNSARDGMAAPSTTAWLDNEIRLRHGWRSFQNPQHISDALKLISEIKVWDEVAAVVGQPTHQLKQQLSLIVDRRNKIAHEADANPSYPGLRWPIDTALVNESMAFVQQVVETIHSLV